MRFSSLKDLFKKPHPIKSGRPLHCIFYSHIWTVYSLEGLGLLNPKTDIILELATESNFAPALNPSNHNYGSLLNLLQTNRHLHQIGTHFKNIPVPMVLAPQPSSSVNNLLSALALVNTDDSPVEKAVILVHINDACKFALAYAHMNRFSIVWDIADHPNSLLPALAELLLVEQCLAVQNWGGIHLCNHQLRRVSDSREREVALRQLLDEFPLLKTI